MVCMDAFIVSHTSMEIELATQEQVDRFLPPCEVPQRIDAAHPATIGGMAFPQDTLSQRVDLEEAMGRVPAVLEEHRRHFAEVFGRAVGGAVEGYCCDDAERVFIASGTVATTLRDVVDARRAAGERVGMIRIKMFRPFPRDEIRALCSGAQKIGVLDRNYAAGTGGIFCHEVQACLQGQGGPLVQGYLTGVGGGDVVPDLVHEVVADLARRETAGGPRWMGIDT
jgi:pyruvate/2-oxoacid:ferredoxin oxidoreductase alpha subunit